MVSITTEGRVSRDGRLRVDVPTSLTEGKVKVVLLVQPGPNGPTSEPTQEEWRKTIARLCGSIDDETFVRPPQSDWTPREPLD